MIHCVLLSDSFVYLYFSTIPHVSYVHILYRGIKEPWTYIPISGKGMVQGVTKTLPKNTSVKKLFRFSPILIQIQEVNILFLID